MIVAVAGIRPMQSSAGNVDAGGVRSDESARQRFIPVVLGYLWLRDALVQEG